MQRGRALPGLFELAGADVRRSLKSGYTAMRSSASLGSRNT
jgi:hypothetical protein